MLPEVGQFALILALSLAIVQGVLPLGELRRALGDPLGEAGHARVDAAGEAAHLGGAVLLQDEVAVEANRLVGGDREHQLGVGLAAHGGDEVLGGGTDRGAGRSRGEQRGRPEVVAGAQLVNPARVEQHRVPGLGP